MKQYLWGSDLKQLGYEDRLKLISLATGLNTSYLDNEYEKKIRNRDDFLRDCGYEIKMGELIDIIYSNTRVFPVPKMDNFRFSVEMEVKNKKDSIEKFASDTYSEYTDALFDIVKQLLDKNYILI